MNPTSFNGISPDWSDAFPGTNLNSNIWSKQGPGYALGGGPYPYPTAEVLPQNVSVVNGKCYINCYGVYPGGPATKISQGGIISTGNPSYAKPFTYGVWYVRAAGITGLYPVPSHEPLPSNVDGDIFGFPDTKHGSPPWPLGGELDFVEGICGTPAPGYTFSGYYHYGVTLHFTSTTGGTWTSQDNVAPNVPANETPYQYYGGNVVENGSGITLLQGTHIATVSGNNFTTTHPVTLRGNNTAYCDCFLRVHPGFTQLTNPVNFHDYWMIFDNAGTINSATSRMRVYIDTMPTGTLDRTNYTFNAANTTANRTAGIYSMQTKGVLAWPKNLAIQVIPEGNANYAQIILEGVTQFSFT